MSTSISPRTRIGKVALIVSDLDRSLVFYQHILGLQVHRRERDTAYLGVGEADLLVLTQHPGAVLVPNTAGLHHFAIVVPSRFDLALALHHFNETHTPLEQFTNHWCSESLYVNDPDGNCIECWMKKDTSAFPRSKKQSPKNKRRL